jgi:hypothetical protein
MRWEVAKQTTRQSNSRPNEAHEESDPKWTTSMHLELPTLGSITARLEITAERLRISIESASTLAAHRLTRGSEAFARALTLSGLLIESLEVTHKCPTPQA